MKKFKKIPHFKTEDEEFEFWSSHDSAEYVDWSKSKKALFPNLKLTSKLISLRLSTSTIDRLKDLANKRDIPYQSLIKVFINREIAKELHTQNWRYL